MENREKIMSNVFVDKKLIHKSCKKDWYIKHNLIHIYDMILSDTSFLVPDTSIRERIFYIENNLSEPMLCPHCNKNILKFNPYKVNLSKHCNSFECKSKHTKKMMDMRYKNMSDEDKKRSCIELIKSSKKRGSEIRGKSIFELYEKEKCEKIKKQISDASSRISNETIQKRINNRKIGLNGKPWHSADTKKRISDTNKETWKSGNLHEKYKCSYEEASKKLSILMKKKILDGSFTPCITNSWTRWKSYIKLESGEIKKFRSWWEAIFWVLNQHTTYEDIRIPYIDHAGNDKIYIVDFHDVKNKKIFEIKPKSLKLKIDNSLKELSAMDWCKKNNYDYICIDEDWIKSNVNRIDLSNHPYLENTIKKLK